MRGFAKTMSVSAIFWIVVLATSQNASAHMMPAHRGTLNIVDNAVFMVISLPASAFMKAGVDIDGDGELSAGEFTAHRARIIESAKENITLDTRTGEAQLVGIMISPVIAHAGSGASLEQIVVLGRFNVTESHSAMYFRVALFGVGAEEQSLIISAKRDGGLQVKEFELSPHMPIGLVSFARYTM